MQPQPNTEALAAAAWAQLGPTLRGWARRRVGDAAAADVVQTVLLRVHERQHQLTDTDRLAPWVWRIARNVVADHHRARRPETSLDAWDASGAPLPPEATEPAPEADELAGLAHWVAWQIDALEPAYADALRLTELEGKTMAEAAAALNLSVSGVKSRVQRGRAQLKARLLRCCAVALDHAGRPVDFHKKPGSCEMC